VIISGVCMKMRKNLLVLLVTAITALAACVSPYDGEAGGNYNYVPKTANGKINLRLNLADTGNSRTILPGLYGGGSFDGDSFESFFVVFKAKAGEGIPDHHQYVSGNLDALKNEVFYLLPGQYSQVYVFGYLTDMTGWPEADLTEIDWTLYPTVKPTWESSYPPSYALAAVGCYTNGGNGFKIDANTTLFPLLNPIKLEPFAEGDDSPWIINDPHGSIFMKIYNTANLSAKKLYNPDGSYNADTGMYRTYGKITITRIKDNEVGSIDISNRLSNTADGAFIESTGAPAGYYDFACEFKVNGQTIKFSEIVHVVNNTEPLFYYVIPPLLEENDPNRSYAVEICFYKTSTSESSIHLGNYNFGEIIKAATVDSFIDIINGNIGNITPKYNGPDGLKVFNGYYKTAAAAADGNKAFLWNFNVDSVMTNPTKLYVGWLDAEKQGINITVDLTDKANIFNSVNVPASQRTINIYDIDFTNPSAPSNFITYNIGTPGNVSEYTWYYTTPAGDVELKRSTSNAITLTIDLYDWYVNYYDSRLIANGFSHALELEVVIDGSPYNGRLPMIVKYEPH